MYVNAGQGSGVVQISTTGDRISAQPRGLLRETGSRSWLSFPPCSVLLGGVLLVAVIAQGAQVRAVVRPPVGERSDVIDVGGRLPAYLAARALAQHPSPENLPG